MSALSSASCVRLANGQHSDELIDCFYCFQLNVCVV